MGALPLTPLLKKLTDLGNFRKREIRKKLTFNHSRKYFFKRSIVGAQGLRPKVYDINSQFAVSL